MSIEKVSPINFSKKDTHENAVERIKKFKLKNPKKIELLVYASPISTSYSTCPSDIF